MPANIFSARIIRGKVKITEWKFTGNEVYDGWLIQVKDGFRMLTCPGPDASFITTPGWGNTPKEAVKSLYAGRRKSFGQASKAKENANVDMAIIESWMEGENGNLE